MKILMVCLGNICRSPLAEGIMQHKINSHGLSGWAVDSAGTSGWHAGNLPDSRSIDTAQAHGIDLTQQRSRQLQISDFDAFDRIYVMDSSNYQNVLQLARHEADRQKVALIMNEVAPARNVNVPDPYYGEFGFEEVFEMLDQATDAIIAKYGVTA